MISEVLLRKILLVTASIFLLSTGSVIVYRYGVNHTEQPRNVEVTQTVTPTLTNIPTSTPTPTSLPVKKPAVDPAVQTRLKELDERIALINNRLAENKAYIQQLFTDQPDGYIYNVAGTTEANKELQAELNTLQAERTQILVNSQ